jgi:hypothetical protein
VVRVPGLEVVEEREVEREIAAGDEVARGPGDVARRTLAG